MKQQLASTTEVAKALGLSRQRVVQLAGQGRIPGATKLSWCWVFTPPFKITPLKRKRKAAQKE